MILQAEESNQSEGQTDTADTTVEEKIMMDAGVHFGHQTSKLNPHMQPYVVGIRNTTHIIDLKKTQECLSVAVDFIGNTIKAGGTIMIVSTKVPLKDIVKETAEVCGIPYATERWLGGTFSNFPIISKRIEHFNNLRSQKEKGAFDKYTKKEQIKIDKELKSLEVKFWGVRDLKKVPEAVFICDIVKDKSCLKESRAKDVKVVAIVDSNADPLLVDYPIPANDDAINSVKYILNKVREAIINAKTKG